MKGVKSTEGVNISVTVAVYASRHPEVFSPRQSYTSGGLHENSSLSDDVFANQRGLTLQTIFISTMECCGG